MKPTLSKADLFFLWITIGLCLAFSVLNDPIWKAVIWMVVMILFIAGVFIALTRYKRTPKAKSE